MNHFLLIDKLKQKETDKLIENKLGSKNIITSFAAWISSTLGWSYNKFL